jgi:hypothetical protein
MKPGDLLIPRRWNVTYGVPIHYLDIWNRPDGSDTQQSSWEHSEKALLLQGRHEDGDLVLVEILLRGEKWWVMEDEVEVAD